MSVSLRITKNANAWAHSADKISALPTGTYSAEFSATGFEDATIEDIAVTAGEDSPEINVVLTPSETEVDDGE